mgnify:CR=1 FL=1|jgi:hypothetical protein
MSDGELIPDEIESTQTFRHEKLKIMRADTMNIRARATQKTNKHP